MNSKLQIGGVMRVVLLGLMISSSASWVSAEEPKKEGAGDVKERALPMQKVPEGVTIQGNRLTALPGYNLKLGPNNKVSAMRPGGGGFGFSGECACVGSGTCFEHQSGPTVSCESDKDKPCDGSCAWVNTSLGVFRAPRQAQ
ncbi:MAG TPA: hypothetical protein VGJ57_01595 [Nitrospirales bacterium]